MALVTYPEYGNDVYESAVAARPKQSRKTHPIRWLAVAAIVPLLVWDAWVSMGESKFHKTPSESVRPFHFGSLNQ
jgi:hypothetical protein